jgi:signal transduction histidine kinase/CheY-like chemotaxis protein
MFKFMGLKAKFAVLFYVVSLSAMFIVGFFGYDNAKNAYTKGALDLAKGYTTEVSVHISDFLKFARSDLGFISNSYALLRYEYWMDIGEEKKANEYLKLFSNTLRGFSVAYPYNAKIRILNNEGREIVTVLHDAVNNQVWDLPEQELQNQAHKDYFIQSAKMPDGSIFASALDLQLGLQQEQGKIAVPHVPVIRFSTPLIGKNNVRYGVIVTNIFAEHFFNYIKEANNNEQGRMFYLIAPNGDYLFHPDTEKRFGSQLGHHANFEKDFPNVLSKMKENKMGVISQTDQIITYQAIYPAPNNEENYWLLVGVVPTSFALKNLQTFEYAFVGLTILVIFLVFLSSRYFLSNMIRPLEFVTNQLQSLSRGEIKLEPLEYSGQDELRVMLDSTQALMTNMERLAQQVDTIGKGDFSSRIEVLSKKDCLSAAINNMSALLQTAETDNNRRNWKRDGLEQLSKALTGDLDSMQLADVSISILGHYLSAGRGVFYSYNENMQRLELLGSYMYSERNQIGSSFKLGEGAIGQVAREKKPIFLTAINADSQPIVTGTNASTPLFTYTYPLLREGTLLGVIELASFERFDEVKLALLQEANVTIASFLYVVQQNERIKKLLVISESAEKLACEQSKRLQETNAQMEEQQQQLQQQTEELQQTNAQMEEQQQQLQQQSEELQQTNAQMEETQQQLQQQNKRLLESQNELDERAKQLELSSQYKSEFLANMSHELRTPLNSIILLSKMMASNSNQHLNNDEVHQAEIIHNAGNELLRLINDVLDLSKIEAGQMELHIESIDSRDFLNNLHELFEHSIKDKNLEFILRDDFHGQFTSDTNRLSQILRNLLSNALKFTKTGGITLSIGRSDNAKLPIKISVKDTGIGIPEEKRKVIFEAFQQADGSISRQYGGTGLGLSISLRFAKLLGGVIELNSVVGQGSEFALLLPETLTETSLPKAPTHSVAQFAQRIQIETQHATSIVEDDRNQLSATDSVILLIDDDSIFGQALLEINRKLGYKTLLAQTGEDGLKLAKRYKPQGILLDLGLPDMDGSEVLHALKTQFELSDIPVYIVSGREKNAALMSEKIMGYLQKPVDVQQIGDAEAELLTFIHKSLLQTILVVENGEITAQQIRELIGEQTATVITATADEDFETLLTQNPCHLTIIDLGTQAVEQALTVTKKLHDINNTMNFVFFGQQPLSDEQEAQMRQYSDSIIIKTAQSEQRLLNNIERFLAQSSSPAENKIPLNLQNRLVNGEQLAGRHILIVDDDARNLFVITSALEKEGAKVDGVLNGRKALDFLKKDSVDMVFLDIMMPEMDGYQTLKEIRNNPQLAHIPVVALTAKALNADREKALATGADDFLSKPVEFEALINMAKVWCAGKHE